MPAVSVIMPVFNAEQFLCEAIESILNQSFTDFEFLIFNDGSNDRSAEIIASYNDPRLIHTNFIVNQGYPKLLNLGLLAAKGKYIARMDADDIAHHDRLKKQYEFMEKNPEYVLCGTIYSIVSNKKIIQLPSDNNEIKLKMLYITPFCHPSVMMRSEVLQSNGILYNTDYMPAEDHELWTRLSAYGKFCNLQEPLLEYRLHGNNISLKKRTNQQAQNLYDAQLNYIKIFFLNSDILSSEAALLHQFFFKESPFTYEELVETAVVIEKAMTGKQQFPVPFQMVNDLLMNRYFYCCNISTHLGITSFRLADKLCGRKKPVWDILKLLIKSLLKYNPQGY